MNTYSNTINSFNTNSSNFSTSNTTVALPAIASLFSSGHTVISSSSELGSQLKVSYANQDSGTTPIGLVVVLFHQLWISESAEWWEQMKHTAKVEVPPNSPDCQVLENKPSSPSTVQLPTSL
ncbi:CXXC-type domain-containing protein [Caerostris extrusa]|uniref:CXXC-type domain-containing protein n=1 Tax=Caerostris extrusa TaxID=172846 RepID=A0AAV4TEP5_CAEEX|nr:CXXC-type domain-containing protein [Caerostris extrusa]